MTTKHLITLENIFLAYGLEPLLDQVKLQINQGERICLIGRNGSGKSSLLKVIAGDIQADHGQIWRKPQLKLARLAQDLPKQSTISVYDFVATGLAETGKLLSAYHALTQQLSPTSSANDLAKLATLQSQIDSMNGWHFDKDITTIIDRLQLNANQSLNRLSGGWQRKATLAKALVSSPDLLLLDEPTNHLDIHAIQWLEEYLLSANVALLFITHDRALLKRLATRIIELDRGKLTSWPGNYSLFLQRKDELLKAEAKYYAEFDKKIAQEEIWIRQGIKARRTRNEGRVRALEAMRLSRSKRRERQQQANFSLNEAEKSGQLVIEAKDISYDIHQTAIVHHFSIRIMRGDRIGLIGPNGIGKSSLLNLLLSHLTPQQGTLTQGTKLQVAYFDQMRQSLDIEKSVIDNVAEGRESIDIDGKKQHMISYLSHFLFTPQRSLTPVKALSGGECNRLLIAKLFSKATNLLILDEPTNDLDIETLELLEELLLQYQGTLLVVSHDRVFLDHVVTSTLVFEGNGQIKEYVGGYQDYLQQKQQININMNIPEKHFPIRTEASIKLAKKLSYKEQKELDELPQKIEALEKEQEELQGLIAQVDFYKQSPSFISQQKNKLIAIESEQKQAYQRWSELEARLASFKNSS